MRRQQLVVMVKLPRPGRVKTRLGRDIGLVNAAWWFRHQVQGLLRRIEDPRWELVLAVAPDHEGMFTPIWPAHLRRMPQGPDDLGARMARVFRNCPPGPVCVIGADIPGVNRHRIAHAFKALGRNDAVFGPAPDGGYWLIGLKRQRPAPPSFLSNVRWSTEHALHDSRNSLPGYRIGLIDSLQDIDTADDLMRLGGKAD